MHSHLQNPFDYFDNIYYINLDSREDRLAQIKKELSGIGIFRAERVSGVINSTPAHGCALSHAKIFADAIEHEYETILIFEDDVEFFPNAIENLSNALKQLPLYWDMFYLGANLDRFPAFQVSPNLARITGAFATHAYAVQKRMFPLLFGINADMNTRFNDVAYAEAIHPIYNCFLTVPLVAGQRQSYSDIENKVMNSNEVFLSRLEKNLVRI